jgi:hypothetical protein
MENLDGSSSVAKIKLAESIVKVCLSLWHPYRPTTPLSDQNSISWIVRQYKTV